MWNEIFLYAICAACGFLAAIVHDKIKDERAKNNKKELDSQLPYDILYPTQQSEHNEEPTVNDDEIEKVQRELRSTFKGFRLVIALLIICAIVATVFAVYYSL